MKEFREFIMRGNVLDLAIGIIIGVAFGNIVTSLVDDVIMPPIGALLGGLDFSSLFINLSSKAVTSVAQAKEAGIPTLNYGIFLTTLIQFVIIAAVLFLVIRTANQMRPPVPAEVTTTTCPYCLSTIPLNAVRCPQCTSQLKAA